MSDRTYSVLELAHYSEYPLTEVESVEQLAPECHLSKPRGLWATVPGDDDWPIWCQDELYKLGRLACATRLHLRQTASILVIRDLLEFDRFSARYPSSVREPWEASWGWVDWRTVALDYDGIVIAPYRPERRFHPAWYYGWDCASGCIWNADAIVGLEPITADVRA